MVAISFLLRVLIGGLFAGTVVFLVLDSTWQYPPVYYIHGQGLLGHCSRSVCSIAAVYSRPRSSWRCRGCRGCLRRGIISASTIFVVAGVAFVAVRLDILTAVVTTPLTASCVCVLVRDIVSVVKILLVKRMK